MKMLIYLCMVIQSMDIIVKKLYILLDPVFVLSTTHPVSVEHNVSFVIDLNSLSSPNDVCADDLDSWKCTGSQRLTFIVKIGPTTCHNVSGSGGKQVQIRRQYHVHGIDSDFHCMITFVEDMEGMYLYVQHVY